MDERDANWDQIWKTFFVLYLTQLNFFEMKIRGTFKNNNIFSPRQIITRSHFDVSYNFKYKQLYITTLELDWLESLLILTQEMKYTIVEYSLDWTKAKIRTSPRPLWGHLLWRSKFESNVLHNKKKINEKIPRLANIWND